MAEPRMNELAEELLRRSRARKVPWEEGPRGPRTPTDSYRVIFPEGAIIMSRVEHVWRHAETGELQGGIACQLDLIGDTGRIIGSLITTTGEPMDQTLVEIFDLAEGYVRERGISKALDFLKSR